MSLFGAASTGVNPQSGSYLSREERIAMFKNASGRRGYAGRSAGGGGGDKGDAAQRATVQATSAIVAVNSMTSTIQQLQVTNQESIQEVQVQVEKNRQDIATLFTNIAEGKEAELVEEKTQTRQDRRRIELGLRAGAESMIEGLGKAVKTTANALGNVAQKTMGPVKGLLDKLFELLGLLGAAWAIDNLPAILNTIDDFTANIPSVGEALENALNFLTGTRGVFSILDRMFQPLKNIIGKIAKKAVDVGAWIARKSGEIFRKIFTKIKDFVVNLFISLKRRLTNLLKNINPFKPPKPPGVGALDDAAEAAVKSGDEVAEAAVRSGDDVIKSGANATDAARNAKPVKNKNILQRARDFIVNSAQKAKNFIGDIVGKGKDFFGAIGEKTMGYVSGKEITTTAAEQKGFLAKMLSPIGKIFGKNTLKTITKLISKIPGIGFFIDYLINKNLDNMNDTEAIIRAMPSSIFGAGGGWIGLQTGSFIGAGLGSVVPGVGTIIGGAIGGIIGAFIGAAGAGAFGDEVGKLVYKNVTGKEPTANEVLFDDPMNKALGFLGDSFGFEVPEDTDPLEGEGRQKIELTGLDTGNEKLDSTVNKVLDFKLPATNLSSLLEPSEGSTPDGMELSSDAKSADESSLNISELPPNFIDQSSMPKTRMEEPKGQAQAVPDFDTADPTMNSYRTTAQLLFEVAS